MGKNIKTTRYMKITIITVAVAVVILGGVIGIIYDKDRINLDTDTLKRTVSIANAFHLEISFEEGFIVMNRGGSPAGQKIDISTLKNAEIKEKTIQVNFKSLFFRDSIEIKKPDSLKTSLR